MYFANLINSANLLQPANLIREANGFSTLHSPSSLPYTVDSDQITVDSTLVTADRTSTSNLTADRTDFKADATTSDRRRHRINTMNPTRYFLLILTAISLFAPNARAAFATIGVGTSANDGTGDTLRAAFVKVNDNFDLSVLNSAGSATNLTIVGGSFSAITNTTLTASKPVFSAADKSLTSTGTVPVDQGGTGLTAWTLNGIPLCKRHHDPCKRNRFNLRRDHADR
jgi:hypothetical protein